MKPIYHLQSSCISHVEFFKVLSFLFYFGLTCRLSVYLFHTLSQKMITAAITQDPVLNIAQFLVKSQKNTLLIT